MVTEWKTKLKTPYNNYTPTYYCVYNFSCFNSIASVEQAVTDRYLMSHFRLMAKRHWSIVIVIKNPYKKAYQFIFYMSTKAFNNFKKRKLVDKSLSHFTLTFQTVVFKLFNYWVKCHFYGLTIKQPLNTKSVVCQVFSEGIIFKVLGPLVWGAVVQCFQ